MAEKKDPRWSKQFGDFGEQLVMYLIGRHKNMKVALVDHAGADLIASDLGNKANRYAISVKSHSLNVSVNNGKVDMESKCYTFDEHNVTELWNFARNFDLQPALSMVIVQPIVGPQYADWAEKKEKAKKSGKYFEQHEQLVIDVFTFLLEDADQMMAEGKPYITKNKNQSVGGFNFNFANRYFEELTADKRIDHVRLRFDPFSDVREWDRQHPMDRNAAQQAAEEE